MKTKARRRAERLNLTNEWVKAFIGDCAALVALEYPLRADACRDVSKCMEAYAWRTLLRQDRLRYRELVAIMRSERMRAV